MWSILFGARNTTTLKIKILMHELSLGVLPLPFIFAKCVFLSLCLVLELGLFVHTGGGERKVHVLGLSLLTLPDVTVGGGSGLRQTSRACLF
jgi:hypothetical protein